MARCIFVGYDRVKDVANRKARTRKNMATLLGRSYEDFCARFDWENLHGEEAAPDGGNGSADARLAEKLTREKLGGYDRAVFVGNAVAEAFGCGGRPFYDRARLNETSPLLVARTPHTSQRN